MAIFPTCAFLLMAVLMVMVSATMGCPLQGNLDVLAVRTDAKPSRVSQRQGSRAGYTYISAP